MRFDMIFSEASRYRFDRPPQADGCSITNVVEVDVAGPRQEANVVSPIKLQKIGVIVKTSSVLIAPS